MKIIPDFIDSFIVRILRAWSGLLMRWQARI